VLSILPTIYGNGLRIVQSPGFVAVTYEMIHETRLIPTDQRPHLPDRVRQYLGDPRGHWEGDTLVVETTNFTDKTTIAFAPTSDALKLVERFTRVGPDRIDYEAMVEDPKTWVKAWALLLPLTPQPGYQLLPYECHEGNYPLRNILSAARVEDRVIEEAVEKGQPPPPPSPWEGNDGFLPVDPSFGRRR
jgi:hypothetical protein